MYLKAIELHGFKSFPEKTKIEFEKGMSAVVGPNGSGKSNISDAIRWVLGETRTSQLRANGKMEDIIFGGTQKRNPMGFASVSLILDNKDRSFDVENDEVAVMRKYYRGGDSEYYINGARVRLRDIQELFFDTGLGKNGYSVVGQGKVSEIVTSKPEGRREIFEEASGIAKFRYKKNEAERKLESAEGNITRLVDILSGLEERVEPLRKESEKAKEFITLSEKKKELEISLWMDTINKSKELIRTEQRKLEIYQADYDNVNSQLEKSEKYIEEKFLYANSLIAKSEENVADIRAADGKISELSSQMAVDKSTKEFEEKQIISLNEELKTFETEGRQSDGERERLSKKISQLKSEIDAKHLKQSDLQIKLDSVVSKSHRSGDEKIRINGLLNTINLDLQDKKIELGAIDSHNTTIKSNLETAKASLEKAEIYAEDSKKQADEVKEFIAITDESINKNKNIRGGLVMKRNSALDKLDNAIKRTQNNELLQRQTLDRIRILTDLENNMDGFAQSVRNILKRSKEGGLGGILGSVAQLITVEKGYETAIEIALGYQLQNIIVENEASAKRAIEYLKNSHGGRATFLPLDTVKPSNFNENLPDWARTGDSIIKADPKFRNIISNLLGRTIIVDDINSASSLAKRLNYRYKIVTMDGQQINAGGSFTGGSVSKSAGLFTRKTEIETLKGKLSKLKEEYNQLDKEKLSAQDAVDNVNSSIEGCDAEIEAFVIDKNNAGIEYARLEQTANQYATTVENLKKDIDNFNFGITNNAKRKLSLLTAIAEKEKEIENLKSKLENIGVADEESLQSQSQLVNEIQQLKLDVVTLQGQISIEENNLSQIELNSENRNLRKNSVLAKIKESQDRITEKNQAIIDVNEKIKELKETISNKEEENRSFVNERLEIEAERTKITAENKDLTTSREELSGRIVKLGERIRNMEIAYDEIISKLWEEYELTVQTAREFCVEITDEAVMKKELAAARNSIRKLGNVNVGAIEEYKEVSERYTYLKGQLEDLQQSKTQLIKLITSLNGEMKTLFTQSFNIINENFGRIFAELFGGGSAKLELTDREDVLNSGIEIVVSPPGKVIKSLTALSGGEQALVAISIYFAILAHNPSPFCVLDEIEAALDDVNVTRYANYLHRICDKTQFIVITHRRGTMEAADVLYGVTMQEDGISKLLKLDINNLSPSILN